MVLKASLVGQGRGLVAAMKFAPQGIIEKAKTATVRPATGIQ